MSGIDCIGEVADEYKRAATLIKDAVRYVSQSANTADGDCKAFVRDLAVRMVLVDNAACAQVFAAANAANSMVVGFWFIATERLGFDILQNL